MHHAIRRGLGKLTPAFLLVLTSLAIAALSGLTDVRAAVNPLPNRPIPPNANLCRAMYVWVSAVPGQDPLADDQKQQALINFCGSTGTNVLFLDIWNYLGAPNWTNAKANRMRQFLDAAHRSGIRVYALTGDVGFAVAHQWVMKNIVEPFVAFNAAAIRPSQQFDGFSLDVEYWQNPGNPSAIHLPGLCDLVKAIRARTDGKPVGCYAGFWLKDATGGQPSVLYNGKNAQDGEHLMDVCDFMIVASYRNHAAFGGTEHGPGQIELSQAWYDYAKGQGRNIGLYVGTETIDVLPAYITYHGKTKAQMEIEHTLISLHFRIDTNAVFMGQVVHNYDGWKAMQ